MYLQSAFLEISNVLMQLNFLCIRFRYIAPDILGLVVRTMSLVNVSVKFQMLISEIFQYFFVEKM